MRFLSKAFPQAPPASAHDAGRGWRRHQPPKGLLPGVQLAEVDFTVMQRSGPGRALVRTVSLRLSCHVVAFSPRPEIRLPLFLAFRTSSASPLQNKPVRGVQRQTVTSGIMHTKTHNVQYTGHYRPRLWTPSPRDRARGGGCFRCGGEPEPQSGYAQEMQSRISMRPALIAASASCVRRVTPKRCLAVFR